MQWTWLIIHVCCYCFGSCDYGAVLTIQIKSAPLLCLDVKGGSTADGTPLDIWECNGSENQLWYFQDGSFQIRYAGDPSKCVDAGNLQGGSGLMLWSCNGMPQQKWGYDTDMSTIFSASSADASTCMDLAGGKTDGGTAVQNWACNGGWGQQWTVSFGITIRASWNYHLCLDLAGGDTNNGKELWMWDCNGSPNQKWYFNSGDYKVRFAGNPNKCLDAGNMQAGNKLMIWDCAGNSQQTWGYDPKISSMFLAKSEGDASLCMDVASGGTSAGTGVDVWGCNGCWNQGFSVVGPADSLGVRHRMEANESSSHNRLGSCPGQGPDPSPGPAPTPGGGPDPAPAPAPAPPAPTHGGSASITTFHWNVHWQCAAGGTEPCRQAAVSRFGELVKESGAAIAVGIEMKGASSALNGWSASGEYEDAVSIMVAPGWTVHSKGGGQIQSGSGQRGVAVMLVTPPNAIAGCPQLCVLGVHPGHDPITGGKSIVNGVCGNVADKCAIAMGDWNVAAGDVSGGKFSSWSNLIGGTPSVVAPNQITCCNNAGKAPYDHAGTNIPGATLGGSKVWDYQLLDKFPMQEEHMPTSVQLNFPALSNTLSRNVSFYV